MERHNVLILSNLHTVEHLEIGIWLISDMETESNLLREKKGDVCKLNFLCISLLCVSCEGYSDKERNTVQKTHFSGSHWQRKKKSRMQS